ncbi:hypothetical protein OG429_24345 [Streptomyces sp. NBC_00190]|uniref:hypothetical protein n=1 Tax=unclassified Streptomyces TaxID=2593676 RepID=UPI002E28EADE|nr:hypothetical protein [Streptomyces sp. NBC_00190]WSZ42148.1 hypothetical protein OG239_27120 [Streptomyces sp. NBC_00868]
MSMRHMVKVRGGAAVVVAAVSALTLAGCGGGSDDKPKASTSQKPAAQPQGSGSSAPVANETSAPKPTEVLATMNGDTGVVLTINSAARDTDGYLTVSGQIKNTGGQAFVATAPWRGNELTSSGSSVAGASLVDKAGKKRYLVLRDTEGRCACSTGISRIGAGESVVFFAQFPAPPATTTEVEFSLPTFATATVKISG